MSDVPPIVAPPVAVPSGPEPLAKIPYPITVLALAAVTLVAFVFGLVRFPRVLHFGIEAEQARRALAAGGGVEAERKFEDVVHAFPDAKDVRIDYADACVKANDPSAALVALRWFVGKEVSKEQNRRLDEIEQEASRRFSSSAGAKP